MESSTRYLETIETLMAQNSKLTKELQDAVVGKLPSNIVSQEMIEQCFIQIARVFGPTAKGSILDEVTFLCNNFIKMNEDYNIRVRQAQSLVLEKEAAMKALDGNDLEEYTELTGKVSKLRGVLEVIKTRLDRLCTTSCDQDIIELRKNLADFLGGVKNG